MERRRSNARFAAPVLVLMITALALAAGCGEEAPGLYGPDDVAEIEQTLATGAEGGPAHEWIAGESFWLYKNRHWPKSQTVHPMSEYVGKPTKYPEKPTFHKVSLHSNVNGSCNPKYLPLPHHLCPTHGYSVSKWVISGSRDADVGDYFNLSNQCTWPHGGVDHFWNPHTNKLDLRYGLVGQCRPSLNPLTWRSPQLAVVRANEIWKKFVLAKYNAKGKDKGHDGRTVAYYYLGHVAHLLTDMSVPAHTRFDVHLLKDGYEGFMSAWNWQAKRGALVGVTNDFMFKRYHHEHHSVRRGEFPSGDLTALFKSMATMAHCFDSNGFNIRLPGGTWVPIVMWGSGSCSKYPGHQGLSYRTSSCRFSREDCADHQFHLQPAAMRHVAALYKLFWDRVSGGETVKPATCSACPCASCKAPRACKAVPGATGAVYCEGSCVDDNDCDLASGLKCNPSTHECEPAYIKKCKGNDVYFDYASSVYPDALQKQCTGGQICAGGACVSNPCAGVTCTTPPAPSCLDSKTLRTWGPSGTCSKGQCSYTHKDSSCPWQCSGDVCVASPCTGVTCNTPPAPKCLDPKSLRTWSANGSCTSGLCSYTYTNSICPWQCSGGACVSSPCAGVTCTTPPGSICLDAKSLRTWNAPGSCSNGVCSYTSTDSVCPGQCSNDACVSNPCAGVTCTTPPGTTCVDAKSLRTWKAPGVCSNGVCSYTFQDSVCPGKCQNNSCTTGCNQCTGGICCDSGTGCFKPSGTPCGSSIEQGCAQVGVCGGQRRERTVTVQCSGGSAACNGPTSPGSWSLLPGCLSTQWCSAGQCSYHSNCIPADVKVEAYQAKLYHGNSPASVGSNCSTYLYGWWANGNSVGGINIRWTWTAPCSLPPSSSPTSYQGDNARWTFSVPAPGNYNIYVKIPAVGYLCQYSPSSRYANAIYYGLVRSGSSGMIAGPFNTSLYKGQEMKIYSSVYLPAGAHTVILYDRENGLSGNCQSNIGYRWIFVDHARVSWDPYNQP